MRRAAVVLALLLLGVVVRAQAPPSLAVTYRSDTSVYVDGGRAQGVAVGDRLQAREGSRIVAELEVAFVAENSASCRVVRQTRPLRTGDRVFKVGGSATPAPQPSATPAPVVQDGVPAPGSSPSPAAAYPTPSPGGKPVGGLTVGVAGAFDGSEASRTVTEQYARYDFGMPGLAGRRIAFRTRGSTRHVSRDSGGLAAPSSERRDRVYEASLSYSRPGFDVMAGRLGAAPFVTLGYLDGVLGSVRAGSAVQAGAFFGREPGIEGLDGDGGGKAGAFVRFAPSTPRLPWELVVSGVRESGSRDYLGLEARVRSGRAYVHGRSEIDLNRDWRAARADAATQLSDLRLDAAFRASTTQNVSVSYDRHEQIWSRWNRELPEWMVETEPLQGLRIAWDRTPRDGWGLRLGGNLRHRAGDDRATTAVFGGIRHPRFFGLATGLDGQWSRTRFTQGFAATARLGRDLAGGHRLDLSYTMNRYELEGLGGTRSSQLVRLMGYAQLGRRGFGQLDVDYAMGDDFEGPRLLAEIGTRF